MHKHKIQGIQIIKIMKKYKKLKKNYFYIIIYMIKFESIIASNYTYKCNNSLMHSISN